MAVECTLLVVSVFRAHGVVAAGSRGELVMSPSHLPCRGLDARELDDYRQRGCHRCPVLQARSVQASLRRIRLVPGRREEKVHAVAY